MTPEQRLGGRYKLVDRLAAGGMGVVYAAEDERLGRRVAVKVLGAGLAEDQRFIERFRREARAAAALAHPNVAAVFDYGEDDGVGYIVMELVEGRDLARVLREDGPMSIERAARVTAQAAAALGHAHARDLVHRDVKPGNILVAQNDHVKVTDFGIARAAGDTTLTATGSVLGSAHYISPEQASGAPATARSDVYSLGIVLYEMLTGALPYTGESALSIAMRHASEDVPSPRELRPEVPPHLEEVVRKATARDPLQRFPEGTAMAAAVLEQEGLALTTPLTGGTTAGPSGTERLPVSAPPIATRWDAATVGKVVLVIALLLLLLPLGAGISRYLSRDENADDPGARSSAGTRPSSTASVPQSRRVPNLVGKRYDDAAARLDALGLEVARADEPSESPPGEVTQISPSVGSLVRVGRTITLTVSTGPVEEDGDEGGKGPGEDNGKGKGEGEGKGKGNGKDKD